MQPKEKKAISDTKNAQWFKLHVPLHIHIHFPQSYYKSFVDFLFLFFFSILNFYSIWLKYTNSIKMSFLSFSSFVSPSFFRRELSRQSTTMNVVAIFTTDRYSLIVLNVFHVKPITHNWFFSPRISFRKDKKKYHELHMHKPSKIAFRSAAWDTYVMEWKFRYKFLKCLIVWLPTIKISPNFQLMHWFLFALPFT